LGVSAKPATLPSTELAATIPTHRPASRAAVVFAFLAIYLIWGSTYLAIWYAVSYVPPLYTAGFRHLIAGGILLAWALAKGQWPTWAQVRASIVIGFLFFLVGHGTLHWAETKIPTGLASLLIASEPIWVFLMACATEKRWRMNTWLGSAFSWAGTSGQQAGQLSLEHWHVWSGRFPGQEESSTRVDRASPAVRYCSQPFRCWRARRCC